MKRAPSGVMVSRWELVDPSRRNECLDTMNYSEAAARKRGWTSMTDAQWDVLADERGVAPKEAQPDLFDAGAVPLSARAAAEAPRPAPSVKDDELAAPMSRRAERGGWMGRRGRGSRT